MAAAAMVRTTSSRGSVVRRTAFTVSVRSSRITAMPVRRGSFRVRLAAIVAGAVVLRLLYVLVLARHVPTAGDSQFFNAHANLVADGKGYIEPFVNAAYGISVPTAAHPPLYPTGLAA